MGTQLIVQEGQAALFVCGGVVADVFYQGTHTLSTDNIPILKKLINLPLAERLRSAQKFILLTLQ